MLRFLVTTLSVCLVSAHEMHTGQCPGFTPMAGFDWEKVSLVLTKQMVFYGPCSVYTNPSGDVPLLSLIAVFLRCLVRDGEVWHQGNLFDLWVQNRQSRLQIHRAGKNWEAESWISWQQRPCLQINEIPYTNKLGIDNHYVWVEKYLSFWFLNWQ